MKFKLRFLLLVCLFQLSLQSIAINSYFNYGRFYSTAEGNYIETYLIVDGSTIKYKKNQHNKYQAGVEVALMFLKNDSVVNAKKYLLTSAEIEDSITKPDLIDVQRFLLAPGEYDLEIVIADNALLEKQFNSKTKIIIETPSKGVFFSDIELLDNVAPSSLESNITKGGYDLTPYYSNFFSNNLNKIIFYTEIYNANNTLGDSSKFVVTYTVEDFNTAKLLPEFAGFSKQNAKNANAILGELSIENLPSGNYNILLEARDKTNKVVANQRVFFQRQKKLSTDTTTTTLGIASYANNGSLDFDAKIKSLDSLIYYVKTFWPISTRVEAEFAQRLLKLKNEQQLRNYIHTFWVSRNKNNPEYEFHKYNHLVKECNAMFSTSQMLGYKTDRGRVYLKYGLPDQRGVYENEPANYPYEIWQYYTINNVRNRRFVFYNPSLATGNYRLLHSDAIGERRNDNWKVELHARSFAGQEDRLNLDNTKSRDYMGNRVDENFENPR